jgi:hypothetical protein
MSLSFFYVEGCPVWSLSSTEVWLSLKPFMGFCCTHGFVPKRVLAFRKSPKTLSLISNKISHKHAAHENHPFLIAETSAQQARHAFPLIDPMSKQTRTIRFVEFTQGNPLLRSATGGTSLHLRVGALIQKFGNFTDLLRIERMLLFMCHGGQLHRLNYMA